MRCEGYIRTVIEALISETEGHDMYHLESFKLSKYFEPYRRVGVYFKPIGAEMHGVITKNFQWLFQKLVTKAAEKSHIPYGILYSYWQKRMSTTLQKSNAKVLHLAEQKGAREIGTTPGINDCILNDNHNYSPL
mmetsp:Transcript_30481/g.56778  ORF Transcript_30481/g.56778 Transcript_30481/m.56778 type:complete len:134 (+) Transcript_30481:84-485(+)